jgi:hypothetical protein
MVAARSDGVAVTPDGTVDDQVFVLRFWREGAALGANGHWRSHVTDINNRRRQTVASVDAAFAVVSERLKAAVDGVGSAPAIPKMRKADAADDSEGA